MSELSSFLVRAKINTYATGGKSAEKRSNSNSKELIYKEKEYIYKDKYFGYNPFIGEEIVWKDNKVLWGMNYFGKVISEVVSPEEIYTFLKEALKKVTEDLPFRGPEFFEKESFKYINKVDGDISSFSGKEIIYYDNKIVYFLYYHGGFVKPK